MFQVLSRFNFGDRLIKRENERTSIAALCLLAGRNAAKPFAIRCAVVYLRLGIRLLGERTCWMEKYNINLGLYHAAAEMELCCANFVTCRRLLDEIFGNARDDKDKNQAKVTLIYCLGSSGKQLDALKLGEVPEG